MGVILSCISPTPYPAMMRLALLFASLLALGCSSEQMDILSHPLDSGGSLDQQLSRSSATVVLAIDPTDFVTCGSHVSRWMEWGRKNPGRLSVVLTRIPDEADRKQLLLYRIRPDAVLKRSQAADRLPTPYEYLVANGRIVFSEQVSAGSPESPLLKAMETGQVAALLKSRSAHVR